MIDIDTLPSSEVNEPVYRVILSRYPQISLFERVSSLQDWDVLYAVESLTNPRLRDEVGDIRLVWSGGKDSTLATWICKQFCEENNLPIVKAFTIDEGDALLAAELKISL